MCFGTKQQLQLCYHYVAENSHVFKTWFDSGCTLIHYAAAPELLFILLNFEY